MMDPTVIPAIVMALLAPERVEPVPFTLQTPQGDYVYQLEIADDPISQMYGLMNRDSLQINGGMAFVYSEPRMAQFWMKNVRFPLDILFLGPCGFVSEIHRDAQPDDQTIISSKTHVWGAVEIAAGEVDRIGIEPGDLISGPQIKSCPAIQSEHEN